jgi:hypothetical protein
MRRRTDEAVRDEMADSLATWIGALVRYVASPVTLNL